MSTMNNPFVGACRYSCQRPLYTNERDIGTGEDQHGSTKAVNRVLYMSVWERERTYRKPSLSEG